MKTYYIILSIVTFSFLSCNNKESKSLDKKVYKNDSVVFFLEKTSNLKNLDKKVFFNFKAFESIKEDKVKNPQKYLDKVISNCYEFSDWKGYNIASEFLLKKATENRDTIYLAKATRYRGNYYYQIKLLDSSFYYYLKSEKFFLKISDFENYAVVLLKKGIVQNEINNFFGAQKSLSKAYSILKETPDKHRIYATLSSLGTVSTELKDYDNAIKYYNKAIDLVSDENLELGDYKIADCLNNIGLLNYDRGKFKEANVYFEKALSDKTIKINKPDLYSLLINNLGYSRLKANINKNLPDLFFESLRINDSLNMSVANVLVYNHLADYYVRKNKDDIAKSYSNKALTIAKQSKVPLLIINSLKQSAIVDKEKSTIFINDFIKLSDSLIVEERKNIDRFARIEFETDELRQENTQLSEQNRDILNYFMLAIVFGGFLFFARFQRLKARELALKQTQQQANEEIYRLIISHQNQLEEGRDLEKKRISKELHDGVLGRLFGLRLNLDGLNNFDDEETKQQRLEYLNELKIIEQDLREISHELSRENLVLINNFVAIINNLLEQQTKINNAKINTLISDKIDWEKVSNTIKINLYRILQESLQNINKHAEAKTINVIFNKDSKGNLIFSIEDDGKGYNTSGKKTKGIGVNNIVERVHQCQGKIDIKSQIGKGTKIIITFPLENETINI